MKRFARLVAFAGLALAGCRSGADASASAPSASASADLPASPVAAPRRPIRRYYMARTGDRCEVYWLDGEKVSPATVAPCPADLLSGERLRIAGKVCMREAAGDPAREQPVVCPDPLTNAEKKERDAGS